MWGCQTCRLANLGCAVFVYSICIHLKARRARSMTPALVRPGVQRAGVDVDALKRERDEAVRQKRDVDAQLGAARREAAQHKATADQHKNSIDQKERDHARLAQNLKDKDTELAIAKAAHAAELDETERCLATFRDEQPHRKDMKHAELLKEYHLAWNNQAAQLKADKDKSEAAKKAAEDQKAAVEAELQAEKSKPQPEADTHDHMEEMKQELQEVREAHKKLEAEKVKKDQQFDVAMQQLGLRQIGSIQNRDQVTKIQTLLRIWDRKAAVAQEQMEKDLVLILSIKHFVNLSRMNY